MANLVFVRDKRTLESRTSPNGLKTVGKWVPNGQAVEDSWRSGRMAYHHSGIASCILTRSDNWYQVPGPDGTEIIRQLSLREKLRLQGLPEDFQLSASPNQAQSQLGNTIPLPFAMQIIRDVRDQYPTFLTSDSLSTTDCWPNVQPRDQDPEEKALMHRRLIGLAKRKSHGKIRRQKQRALMEEDSVLKMSGPKVAGSRHTDASGKLAATRIMRTTRTTRWEELDEQIEVLERVVVDLKMERRLINRFNRDGSEYRFDNK